MVSLPIETKKSLKARILDDPHANTHQGGRVGQGYSSGHNFRILSLHSPCSLRLQAFDAEYRTKLFQCNYELDGVVAGFEIHPSNEYLIAVSDQGFFYIFKLETGELRGKVPIMSEPLDVALDPSGLYLAVTVNNNSIEPGSQVRKKWMLKSEKYSEIRSRTRVLFYEVGTGSLASEISCLFEISSFNFSPNGKFFVAGSKHGCVSIWAIGERLQSIMSLSPSIWASYPLYIKNEYMQEIEEANEQMTRAKINRNIDASQYVIPDHKYNKKETAPLYKPKNQHPGFSPRHHHVSSVATDHQKLLKEREKKFLRTREISKQMSPHTNDDQIQDEYDHLNEDPHEYRDTYHRNNRDNYPPEEHKGIIKRDKVTHEHRREEKTIDTQPQRILTPKQPLRNREDSPREVYSIIPPESAYFKVDEISVQPEDRPAPRTPESDNSKVPEVGSSFEDRAKSSNLISSKYENQRHNKRGVPSKWNDIDRDDINSDRKQGNPVIDQKYNEGLPYPAPAYLYQAMAPPNVVYQSPDGRPLAFQQYIPVVDQNRERKIRHEDHTVSDSRSYTTPSKDRTEEGDRSSILDYSRNQEPYYREVREEEGSLAPIPPYHRHADSKYTAPQSKLAQLYRKREEYPDMNPRQIIHNDRSQERREAAPIRTYTYVPVRERVDEIPVGKPAPHSNLKGVRHPQKTAAAAKRGPRPDPIDIDDEIEITESSARIQDPEELHRAFVSGLRKPDNQPMSLQRFRKECSNDIVGAQPDSDDIDKLSDSNYSFVEQAYKDMEDFDTKIDLQHSLRQYENGRIQDPRAHNYLNKLMSYKR